MQAAFAMLVPQKEGGTKTEPQIFEAIKPLERGGTDFRVNWVPVPLMPLI